MSGYHLAHKQHSMSLLNLKGKKEENIFKGSFIFSIDSELISHGILEQERTLDSSSATLYYLKKEH